MDAISWKPPFALVADDLTGACDAGVHFLAAGWRVEVAPDPMSAWPAADLLVVSTRTRGATPTEARRVVGSVAERLRTVGRPVLYKKLDSTLHGNYGAEIAALLAAGVASTALICPAFPDMGRRLIDGELRMGPARRATGRNLVERVREQCGQEVTWHPTTFLRQPTEEVVATLRSSAHRQPRLVIFDAVEEADLERVVAVGIALQGEALLCGSTGLARRLGRALSATRTPPSPPKPSIAPQPTPAPLTASIPPSTLHQTVPEPNAPGNGRRARRRIALIGSRSPVTTRQIEVLAQERGARVMPPQAPGLRSALAAGATPVVVMVDLGSTAEGALAEVIEGVRAGGPAALLLSGGDTAQRFCDLAGVRTIRLGGEIEMGLPHGRLGGGWCHDWPVATKAGGFGDDFSLVRWADSVADPTCIHPSPG